MTRFSNRSVDEIVYEVFSFVESNVRRGTSRDVLEKIKFLNITL